MMSRLMLIAVLGSLGLLVGCRPDVAGAPCLSDDNCPRGQFCASAGRCVLDGSPDARLDGGSSGTGGGTGGGNDGGTGDGGVCLDAQGKPTSTAVDPANCGACGHVCPAALNATTRCVAGRCGRGPCTPGFFDVDGVATFGCESTCVGHQCSSPDGGTVTITNDPLPEAGSVWQAISNGASFAGTVQTNGTHTNVGFVGDATPAVGGGVEVKNQQNRHLSGSGIRAR